MGKRINTNKTLGDIKIILFLISFLFSSCQISEGEKINKMIEKFEVLNKEKHVLDFLLNKLIIPPRNSYYMILKNMHKEVIATIPVNSFDPNKIHKLKIEIKETDKNTAKKDSLIIVAHHLLTIYKQLDVFAIDGINNDKKLIEFYIDSKTVIIYSINDTFDKVSFKNFKLKKIKEHWYYYKRESPPVWVSLKKNKKTILG